MPETISRIDTIKPFEDTILRALHRYHYLTSEQLTRLLYRAGSLNLARERFRLLVERGLVQKIFLPRREQRGSAPSLYTLARAGLSHLAAQGHAVSHRARPSEERARSYLFLAHTLAVNDFLIAVELLCREYPYFTLSTMLHERHFLREAGAERVYVQVDGKRVAVIPDGWVDLRIAGREQRCFLLELDRGTEEQKKWRLKVRALLAYAAGPYAKRFGTTSLTILVVTTTGDERLRNLMQWTKEEIAARKGADHDLFRFTSIAMDRTDPADAFFSPCWYPASSNELLPLLPRVGEQ